MNDLASQYHIIAEGAGWMDRRAHGRLKFQGSDVVAFLHALVTNDVQSLVVGTGTYAALLSPQGRMLTDLTIHRLADHLLAVVPAGQAEALITRFDDLIFSEQVQVTNVTEALAQIGVVGPDAAAVIGRVFALSPIPAAELEALPILGHRLSGDTMVVRTDVSELPMFEVFVPSRSFDAAVHRLAEMGVTPVSLELDEAMRIEAGRPMFGVDMTAETIPLEAGLLERAISTTKGCYVGQEVIIRILHRGGGRVVKRLVKLDIDATGDDAQLSGAALVHDGRPVGLITSVSRSPRGLRIVALGYVHRDLAEVGRQLEVDAPQGRHRAEVIGLAG